MDTIPGADQPTAAPPPAPAPPAVTLGSSPETVSRGRTEAAIALFGFATALFVLCLVRFLAFIPIPLPVFLIVLAAGIPLGGFLVDRPRFAKWDLARAILATQATMAIALVATLFHRKIFVVETFPPVPAGDASVVGLLLGSVAVQAVCFGPFFVAVGGAGLVALRAGAAACGGSVRLAWLAALTGAAVACLLMYYGIVWTGLVPLAIGSIAAAGAGRTLLLRPSFPVGARASLVLALALVPRLDAQLLRFALPDNPQATQGRIRVPPGSPFFSSRNQSIDHDAWTRHHHIMLAQGGLVFDNGVLVDSSEGTETWPADRALWLVVITELPRGIRGAYLGVGTWQDQVRSTCQGWLFAPPVLPSGATDLARAGGRRYGYDPIAGLGPVVTTPLAGRHGLETTGETFGVIPIGQADRIGTSLSTLLVPPDWLGTEEALVAMRARLQVGTGTISVLGSSVCDAEGRTFLGWAWMLQKCGMQCTGWFRCGRDSTGVPDITRADPMARGLTAFLILARPGPEPVVLSPEAITVLRRWGFEERTDSPPGGFVPFTDDRPFPSVVLLGYLKGTGVVSAALGLLAALALATAALVRALWRRQAATPAPAGGGLPLGGFVIFAGAAALVGESALLLLHVGLYRLMRLLADPLDATLVGPVFFCAAAGLGIALATVRPRLQTILAFTAGLLDLLGLVPRDNASALVLVVPPLLVTGRLLAALFGRAASQQAIAFVLGTIGGVLGLLLAATWPVLNGFRSYDRLSFLVFFVAVFAAGFWLRAESLALLRRRRAGPPRPGTAIFPPLR